MLFRSGNGVAQSGNACVARGRALTRRGIGRVRLGLTLAQLTRRAGTPSSRKARSVSWCVRGGGTVSAVIVRRRAVLVASTVRGARVGRLRVGARAPRRGGALRRRGHVVYRVRRGRIVMVAVTRSARRWRTYARSL